MPDQNPRGPFAPSYDPRLVEMGENPDSLVEDLGADIDECRQLAVELGVRPYTVHAVKVRWSGGEVGRGEPSPLLDLQILPTPKQVSIGSMAREAEAAGAVERGDVMLSGVSPRYTEDEIDSMFGVGAAADEECFIEIRMDARDGTGQRRRRFTLAKPPERKTSEWRVTLRRSTGDRARDGTRRPARQERWGR